LIGEVIAEFKGKTTGVRVLSEGKVETSEQGSGRILGIEATAVFTSLAVPLPNGILMGEGDGIITTADGEVVMVKKSGIKWPTRKGWKASRGAFFHMTQSQKLARLNRVVGVFEYESDEKGDWTAKIWEWK